MHSIHIEKKMFTQKKIEKKNVGEMYNETFYQNSITIAFHKIQ